MAVRTKPHPPPSYSVFKQPSPHVKLQPDLSLAAAYSLSCLITETLQCHQQEKLPRKESLFPAGGSSPGDSRERGLEPLNAETKAIRPHFSHPQPTLPAEGPHIPRPVCTHCPPHGAVSTISIPVPSTRAHLASAVSPVGGAPSGWELIISPSKAVCGSLQAPGTDGAGSAAGVTEKSPASQRGRAALRPASPLISDDLFLLDSGSSCAYWS